MDRALQVEPGEQHPAANAACWLVSERDGFAETAIRQLLEEPISETGPGRYSMIWSFALAYDWLFSHPGMTPENRVQILARLGERLRAELDGLDGDYMALWHGRNQAANGAMIAALATAHDLGESRLLERALAHWMESLRALRFSEGWPEGASYWIYNRAGPYALASDCVMSATAQDRIDGVAVRDVMKTIGYWQLYQYGPNGVFEPYGDSSGSLRLGETGWWTLTTDYYARLSRDPGVAAAGDYFRGRSPDPYGKRNYYWYVALSYDPTVRPPDLDYDPGHPELWMRRHLPQSKLFGRDSYGVAFLRGELGDPNELFASFKAGDLLAHHDHYDSGNLTIQRGGNLLPQTGYYGDYTQKHRLGYQVQTVSANSILVLAPGEYSNYLQRNPDWWPWLSGGQRVISPTGFDCVDRDHFERQRLSGPQHLERSEIAAWESAEGWFDYVASDITAAYNSTRFAEPGNQPKVSRVTRQVLFLRPQEVFLVFDRVDVVDTGFVPKVVYHALSRPESETEEVLVGTRQDGILQSADRHFWWEVGEGRLDVEVLLPPATRSLKIGGPSYCFYVEADGDQSDGFDGSNLSEGAGRRGGHLSPDQWRIEIEPKTVVPANRFLTLLWPRLREGSAPRPVARVLDTRDGVVTLAVADTLVVFSADGAAPTRYEGPQVSASKCLVLDAVPNGRYRIGGVPVRASGEGMIVVRQPFSGPLTIAYE